MTHYNQQQQFDDLGLQFLAESDAMEAELNDLLNGVSSTTATTATAAPFSLDGVDTLPAQKQQQQQQLFQREPSLNLDFNIPFTFGDDLFTVDPNSALDTSSSATDNNFTLNLPPTQLMQDQAQAQAQATTSLRSSSSTSSTPPHSVAFPPSTPSFLTTNLINSTATSATATATATTTATATATSPLPLPLQQQQHSNSTSQLKARHAMWQRRKGKSSTTVLTDKNANKNEFGGASAAASSLKAVPPQIEVRSNNMVDLDLAKYPEHLLGTTDYGVVKRFLSGLSTDEQVAFKKARRRFKGRNYSSKSRKTKSKLQDELDRANSVIDDLRDQLDEMSLAMEDSNSRNDILLHLLRVNNVIVPNELLEGVVGGFDPDDCL